MSLNAMYGIARQEFVRLLTEPLVIVVGFILLVIIYLNGAGDVRTLVSISSPGSLFYSPDAFFEGYSQPWWSMVMVCMIMAAFLGATTVPLDRWKNSLNVLFTKPLYQRDYLLGKFLGISSFMLLFNMVIHSLTGLMVAVFFRGPLSMENFAVRVSLYIIVLTLACSLVIALNMLFGVLSKNVLFVTAAAMTYVFIDWFWYSDKFLGSLSILTPTNLYHTIVTPTVDGSVGLYGPAAPLLLWLQTAFPYLLLLFIEVLVFLYAGIRVFSREERL